MMGSAMHHARILGTMVVGVTVALFARDAECADSGVDPRYLETFVEAGARVVLQDASSGSAFTLRNGDGTTVDDGLIHHVYSNELDTEVLDLIKHPGDSQGSFAEVALMLSDSMPFGATPVRVKRFFTSRGVHLGMAQADVLRGMGKPHRRAARMGRETFEYRCDNPAVCPSLAVHNMPTYYATLTFKSGKVIEYRFGYEYP